MREIKFRAWNTESKEFHYTCECCQSNFWNVVEGAASFQEPQQYTGLNDYEDKPIYEGDILEDGRVRKGVIVGLQSGLVFMFLSEYKDWIEGAPLVIYEAVADMQTSSFLNNCHVLGNIYQNEDLLTN